MNGAIEDNKKNRNRLTPKLLFVALWVSSKSNITCYIQEQHREYEIQQQISQFLPIRRHSK